MIIYPAIDLLNKQCVRLKKGDFNESTIYSNNPLETAKHYENLGATHLHIIDLNGAKDNSSIHDDIIKEICSTTSLKIQVGGGIRSLNRAKQCIQMGVDKVILGSIAITNISETTTIINTLGSHRVTLAVDVRIIDGLPTIAIHGWKDNVKSLWETLACYSRLNSQHILCTDIDRDGILVGPNLDLYREINSLYPQFLIQGSGGIGSIDDLNDLSNGIADAAVIGRALYENKFTLTEALKFQ